MIRLKDIMEMFRLGLIIDYYSVEEVIDWIDYIIEIEEQPDYELIDISLSKKNEINLIVEKLNQIEYERKWDMPPKILLGIFYKELLENKGSVEYLKSFAKKLYKLSLNISDESVGEDVNYDLLTAEDYLESALYYDANVTIESFIIRMENLLEPFHIYAIEYEKSIYKKINEIVEKEKKIDISGDWYNFDEGRSVGANGSENGIIIKDEEYSKGARVTLEKCENPQFTITLGVYGLACVTNYYADIEIAEENFDILKTKVERLIDTYPLDNDDNYDIKMNLVHKLLDELQN